MLTAPEGTDVYSRFKDLLKEYGYRVSYINPKDPQIPRGIDLLIWTQPRRDTRCG